MLPPRYSIGLDVLGFLTRYNVLIFAAFVVFLAPCSYLAPSNLRAGEPRGPLASFGEKRSYSDKSGKFKIEGKLKFADENEAQILKADGKVVTVPFDKLSTKDALFIKAFLSAEKVLAVNEGTEEDSENPFAGGMQSEDSASKPPAGKPSSGKPSADKSTPSRGSRDSGSNRSKMDDEEPSTSDESATDNQIPKRKAKNTGFKPLSLVPAKAFWSAKQPASFPDVTFEDCIVQTSLKKPFFAKMHVLGGGKSGSIVLNAYQDGKRGESYGRFAIVSATTSEVTSTAEYPDPWKLMAISPDGSRFAAVRVEGFDKGNDVAIFRIVDGQIQPEFQFVGGGGAWDELHWMAFLPNNQLATISQKHNLTLWDLENKIGPKALKQGSTGNSLTASITPAGELIAFISGNSIVVMETGDGKMVGAIKGESPFNTVAFSPDAKTVAAFRPFQVSLYGTQDGKEIKTIPVTHEQPNTSLHWLGKDLMVGSTLYDTTTGLPIWNYEIQGVMSSFGSYLIAGFGNDNDSSIGLYRLPHDSAQDASKADLSSSYALKPGSSVSVEYNFGPTPQETQVKIREAISNKIKKLEWVEANGSENVIQVSITQGKSDTVDYYTQRGFGPIFAPPGFGPPPSGPADKVTFTPWTHTLVILNDGKKVYNLARTATAPQVLQEAKGETTQQTVDRICKPNADYFANASIPPYVLSAEFQDNVGKSNVTAEGLK